MQSINIAIDPESGEVLVAIDDGGNPWRGHYEFKPGEKRIIKFTDKRGKEDTNRQQPYHKHLVWETIPIVKGQTIDRIEIQVDSGITAQEYCTKHNYTYISHEVVEEWPS